MNLLKIFSDSFQDNWEAPALTSLETGLTLDYGSLAARMARVHGLLEQFGVKIGSRVVIAGRNSVDWVTAYMSVITHGAVAVVIPPGYGPDDIVAFAGMADGEFMFIDRELWDDGVDLSMAPTLRLVLSMDTSDVLMAGPGTVSNPLLVIDRLDMNFIERYPLGFQPSNAKAPVLPPDAVVSIFFTAGTTGTPKAVMLSADSIEGNLIFGLKKGLHPAGTRTLSVVALGNIWGCVYDMMTSLASGAELCLGPVGSLSPETAKAFKRVKPRRVLLSPKLVEGLFRRTERHIEQEPFWRFISKVPLMKSLKNIVVRKSFKKLLGGKCEEIVLGCSMISPHLDWTLHKAHVRFTVVYGLVEVGGIITYTPSSQWRSGTVGGIVGSLTQCRLRPLDLPGLPEGAGELQIKGMTVMKGYYGDPDMTREVLDAEGWLSTGDIATISPQGAIRILGRIDSAIGTEGGVVFPEKLELRLLTQPGLKNTVVVERDGRLTAVIEPDRNYMTRHDIHPEDVNQLIEHAINEVNRMSPLNERINDFEISEEPLLLTPKGTVRRYEYV